MKTKLFQNRQIRKSSFEFSCSFFCSVFFDIFFLKVFDVPVPFHCRRLIFLHVCRCVARRRGKVQRKMVFARVATSLHFASASTKPKTRRSKMAGGRNVQGQTASKQIVTLGVLVAEQQS